MTTRRKNEVTLRAHGGLPLVTVPCTFTEVHGIRVAVHRHWRSKHGGLEMIPTRLWAVTEPLTGTKVTGMQASREEALQAAHARISAEGGAEAMQEAIKRTTAWQQGADLV